MIEILRSIIDIIVSLVNFLIHTIQSLFILLSNMPAYITFMNTSINVLPDVIIPFAVASVSVYVVFLILGRG